MMQSDHLNSPWPVLDIPVVFIFIGLIPAWQSFSIEFASINNHVIVITDNDNYLTSRNPNPFIHPMNISLYDGLVADFKSVYKPHLHFTDKDSPQTILH